jgi:cellulose synthase/poly-beta-1,6-N-acetylglucosamine synthase-like glycosyltransferase
MSSEQVIFWAAIVLLGYTYVGYPVLLWVWAALRAREPRAGDLEPTVSIVVVAYNEAPRIREKVENLLALDYPSDRLEIVLASDGSTDDTAAQARRCRNAGVTVVAFKARRGKSAVLNDLIPEARGEIVVLADARQRFEPGTLRALVAQFADPKVGAVSGDLILTDSAESAVGEGVGFYWKYEKFIRRNESRIDSTVGATGAIYAIRRALFEPIPEDTLLDDVLIPMRIVRRGYRVLFEPSARAYDQASATAGIEFERKVRTLAGNFQLFARERWLLNPFSNRLWLQTISHKGCRLLSPLCLAAALAANLFLLVVQPLYRWVLAVQVVFYAAAAGGYLLRNAVKKHFFLNVPYTFCLLNWAVVTGFFRLVNGRQRVTWERADGYRDVTLRRGR